MPKTVDELEFYQILKQYKGRVIAGLKKNKRIHSKVVKNRPDRY